MEPSRNLNQLFDLQRPEQRPEQRSAVPDSDPPLFPQDSKLYFPIVERPIAMLHSDNQTLTPAPDHKAIAAARDGNPVILGIVGSKYKPVPNRQLFTAVENAMESSFTTDELTGVKTYDALSYDGAWCQRRYSFPNFTRQIQQAGRANYATTEISFDVRISNTYDGSGSAKLKTLCVDGMCENGLVFTSLDVFARRHTAGFQLPHFAAQLKASRDRFIDQAVLMQRWANRSMNAAEVRELLKQLPKMSERRAKAVEAQYHREAAKRGQTVWALVSAMTNYSSHNSFNFPVRDTGRDNEAATLDKRTDEVTSWLRSAPWRELEAA